MPTIHAIETAVYKVLKSDGELAGLCTVFNGNKRPSNAANPALTVTVERLEPGMGTGIWMCDVIVATYTDELANSTADNERMETIDARVHELLTDAELVLEGAKALPLIEGYSTNGWSPQHPKEHYKKSKFGLVFVYFNDTV
jgi:hypothetical protein